MAPRRPARGPWRRAACDPEPVPVPEPDLAERADVVEEALVLCGRELDLVRPRDSEALLDEHAFEHEEFLPYWAELWPSALGLARAVCGRALRGARTVELGCGLGLGGLAAALAGGRVLATDWSADAVAFAAANARRNGLALETAVVDWARPDAIVDRAPWDFVIASDVLYERRNGDLLLDLLPRLVEPGGEVWIADPGRLPAQDFFAAADDAFERRQVRDRELKTVTVHRMRRRVPGS
jgi:predicted nicotinamide N-methyase